MPSLVSCRPSVLLIGLCLLLAGCDQPPPDRPPVAVPAGVDAALPRVDQVVAESIQAPVPEIPVEPPIGPSDRAADNANDDKGEQQTGRGAKSASTPPVDTSQESEPAQPLDLTLTPDIMPEMEDPAELPDTEDLLLPDLFSTGTPASKKRVNVKGHLMVDENQEDIQDVPDGAGIRFEMKTR